MPQQLLSERLMKMLRCKNNGIATATSDRRNKKYASECKDKHKTAVKVKWSQEAK